MTTFDITVSIASIVVAGVTIAWLRHLTIHAGRDRPNDPERLRRFIENAPSRFHNRDVFTRATEVLRSEAAAEAWMNGPCIGLDNEKPIDLVTTSSGAAAAMAYLNRIGHGVPG